MTRVQRAKRFLEQEIAQSLSKTRGLALAYFSAQNIDRFVTFFRASKKSGRAFVIDVYLAQILHALETQESSPTPAAPTFSSSCPKR